MIHETLKEYLETGIVSERDLAEKLGVSISYINMLKRGERRPSPELAQKIETITGIPFRSLLLPESRTA